MIIAQKLPGQRRIKNIYPILYGIALTLLASATLTGCAAHVQNDGGSLPEVVGSMELKYANQFSVDYLEDGSALAEIADGRRYLIVPDGAEPTENIPGDITVLRQPENIYLASSSAMDLFGCIGGLDDILACSTPESGWKLPDIAQAMADEDILYAGKYSSPDIELLMSEGCDAAIENTMIYHSPKIIEQIENCGIPVLIERSSYESHPLGRLEWVRLYGLILGKTDEAERLFSEKCALLDDVISQESADCTAAFFYISSNGYAVVRKPGDYISKMIGLAGGKYILDADSLKVDENALSTANIQFEAFYAMAKDADYLIYNGTIDGGVESLEQLSAKNPLLADFRAFRNGNVWCTNANVFQQTSAATEMTEELHRIFTGGSGNFEFFHKLS